MKQGRHCANSIRQYQYYAAKHASAASAVPQNVVHPFHHEVDVCLVHQRIESSASAIIYMHHEAAVGAATQNLPFSSSPLFAAGEPQQDISNGIEDAVDVSPAGVEPDPKS